MFSKTVRLEYLRKKQENINRSLHSFDINESINIIYFKICIDD